MGARGVAAMTRGTAPPSFFLLPSSFAASSHASHVRRMVITRSLRGRYMVVTRSSHRRASLGARWRPSPLDTPPPSPLFLPSSLLAPTSPFWNCTFRTDVPPDMRRRAPQRGTSGLWRLGQAALVRARTYVRPLLTLTLALSCSSTSPAAARRGADDDDGYLLIVVACVGVESRRRQVSLSPDGLVRHVSTPSRQCDIIPTRQAHARHRTEDRAPTPRRRRSARFSFLPPGSFPFVSVRFRSFLSFRSSPSFPSVSFGFFFSFFSSPGPRA